MGILPNMKSGLADLDQGLMAMVAMGLNQFQR